MAERGGGAAARCQKIAEMGGGGVGWAAKRGQQLAEKEGWKGLLLAAVSCLELPRNGRKGGGEGLPYDARNCQTRQK